METSDQQPEDVITLKAVFTPSTSRAENSGNIHSKMGYTAVVKNIYGIPPPPPEENNEEINDINTIFQGNQTQR